jgi:hypothetical protein
VQALQPSDPVSTGRETVITSTCAPITVPSGSADPLMSGNKTMPLLAELMPTPAGERYLVPRDVPRQAGLKRFCSPAQHAW